MGVRSLLKGLRASDKKNTSTTPPSPSTSAAATDKNETISIATNSSTLQPVVSVSGVSVTTAATDKNEAISVTPSSATLEPVASISSVSVTSKKDDKPRDLWDEAWTMLSEDDPKLKQKYEDIILTEGGRDNKSDGNNLAAAGSYEREEQLRQIAKNKVDAIDLAKWQVQIGGHSVDVSGQFDKAVKIVVAAKDFVSSAVSSEPHAALAWAGVCVFLPLLLNPSEQKTAARDGLEAVPFVVRRLRVMERLTRPANSESTGSRHQADSLELVEDFENTAVKLYQTILEFQIRFMRQHSNNWAKRYGRNIFKADDWNNLTSRIKDLEVKCTEIAKDLSRERIERALQDSEQNMQQGLQKIQQELEKTTRGIEKQTMMQSAWRQTDEERNCVQLFRQSNPYENQKNRTPKAVPKTGKWFLENQKFIDWRKNEGPDLLWLSAKPGSGKSVLARTLIDDGLLTLSHQKQSAVCYFFFKDISPYQRSALSAISAILHQLFSAFPSLVKHAVLSYNLNGKELLQLFDEMFDILCQAAADPDVGQVVCVLDALDECNDDDRSSLVKAVTNFYHGAKNASNVGDQPKLKFLMTSRPYYHIHLDFHDVMEETPTIHLSGDHESEKIKDEIDHVIGVNIPKLAVTRGFDKEATKYLVDKLRSVENRTYLWLSLIMEEIRLSERPSNKRELNKIISNLPRSVIDAFDSILKRCRHPELARQLLHIILAAREPLAVDDMRIATALASDLEYRSYEEIGTETSDAFEVRIKTICGLMVTVDGGVVLLIHQTAKEFLLKDDNISQNCGTWKFSFSPLDSEILLAKICITLLSFTCFSKSPLTIDTDDVDEVDKKVTQYTQDHAFLRYASMNWVDHAQSAKIDDDSKWVPSMSSLCRADSPMCRTWYTIYQRAPECRLPWKTTSLNLAAEFEFTNVLASLLQSGANPNEPDGRGATPLARSVRKSRRAVEILLDAKADVNSHEWEEIWYEELDEVDSEVEVKPFAGTPLTMAVFDGDAEMVQYLIDRGAKMDFPPSSSLTPLRAAYLMCSVNPGPESEELLRLLVRLGANVCFETIDEDMPVMTTVLHLAAMEEDSSLLQVLLDSKTADVNFRLRESPSSVRLEDQSTDEDRSSIHESELSIRTRSLSHDRSNPDSARDTRDCAEGANSDGDGEEDDNTSMSGSQNSDDNSSSGSDNDDSSSESSAPRKNYSYLIGATPLHLAVKDGLVDNVKLILERGAKPGIKNSDGHTAMDLALGLSSVDGSIASETVDSLKTKLIELLKKHGHTSPDGPYDFDAVPPPPQGSLGQQEPSVEESGVGRIPLESK